MKTIYAALLLHKLGKQIDEKSIKHIITSAGSEVDESEIKSLITSLKGVDIDKELESASLVSVSQPVSAGVSSEAKKEEVVEEKHEAAAEGLSALFG